MSEYELGLRHDGILGQVERRALALLGSGRCITTHYAEVALLSGELDEEDLRGCVAYKHAPSKVLRSHRTKRWYLA